MRQTADTQPTNLLPFSCCPRSSSQANFNFEEAGYLEDSKLRSVLEACDTFPQLKQQIMRIVPPPPNCPLPKYTPLKQVMVVRPVCTTRPPDWGSSSE
jgi:hypothetical protein